MLENGSTNPEAGLQTGAGDGGLRLWRCICCDPCRWIYCDLGRADHSGHGGDSSAVQAEAKGFAAILSNDTL